MSERIAEKLNDGTIKISGKVDSKNAAQFEKEVFEALGESKDSITVDAADLEYISSAGLRVFLKMKKAINGDITVTNVSSDVFDIFDVTGFTSFINVSKKLREVNIEGCEVIGVGANGTVYRLDEETIIKVFAPSVPLSIVKEERDFAQAAFIAGVPTAISYDVVKCGDSFGAVYEMLDANTVAAVIKAHPERAQELGTRLGKLLKELHNTQGDPDVLTNMLDIYRQRAAGMSKYYTTEETEKLKSVYAPLAQSNTIVHGDFHVKNVMLMNDELVFIDMGDVGYGHPILDLGGTYLGMVRIGKFSPDAVEHYIGINYELSMTVWNALTEEYFGKENAETGRKLAEIYGEAKYALVPYIYTKFDEATRQKFIAGERKTGIISPDFDISHLQEYLDKIYG